MIPAAGRRHLRNGPAYLQIIRGRLRIAVTYRQNVLFMFAVVVVQIVILGKVWTALYGGAGEVGGVPLSRVLVYLTIANLQTWVMHDVGVASYIHSRIREGQVAFDLLRPVGFMAQMMAHLAGATLATVIFAVAALPVVALAGTLGPPASPAALSLWLVSLLCGFVISMVLNLIIGLIAFWTMEINGLTMLLALIGQFFAGAFVPLNFFPDFLRTVAALLPFQATTFTPVAIYVGQLAGYQAVRAIGVQLLWIVLLALGARLVWHRALHRVVVQGG